MHVRVKKQGIVPSVLPPGENIGRAFVLHAAVVAVAVFLFCLLVRQQHQCVSNLRLPFMPLWSPLALQWQEAERVGLWRLMLSACLSALLFATLFFGELFFSGLFFP